jgi:hypothetical protein
MTKTWKLRLVIGLAVASVAAVGAQAPAGSSLAFGTTGTCQAPTAGMTILCLGTAGVQVSTNGAAYAAVGATGPQGPAGPAGATGPQGPAGPAGTLPTAITCTGLEITSAGVSLTGCT